MQAPLELSCYAPCINFDDADLEFDVKGDAIRYSDSCFLYMYMKLVESFDVLKSRETLKLLYDGDA